MKGFRYSWLSVTFALAITSSAMCQGTTLPVVRDTNKAAASVCKVYALSDMSEDAKLCQWIADSIPEMIGAGSWNQAGTKINYFAPGRMMVVNHSPAIHAQIEAYLDSVRKAVPKESSTSAKPMVTDSSVLPAAYLVNPESSRTQATPPSASQAYPVPFPPQAPKHLFHFIIRYEGEGIIDSSVVKFANAMVKANALANESRNSSPMVSPVPACVNNPPMYSVPIGAVFPGNQGFPMMPPADPVGPASGVRPSLPPSLPPGVLSSGPSNLPPPTTR